MTDKQLRKAQILSGKICETERDIKDIEDILADYDSFGSNIEFKRNSDSYSKSFGSKKYSFKTPLKEILSQLKYQLEINLQNLKNEFKEI